MKLKNLLTWSLLGVFLMLSPAVYSASGPKIKVVALFSGKAMLSIDGKRQILKEGQTSKEGILLVRATSKGAVIEINGEQKNLKLGSDVSTQLSQPESHIVRIPNRNNMFLTNGKINGKSADFIVDTGASVVAITRPDADRLRIPYLDGAPAQVSTAADIRNAWHIKLNSVSVGSIKVYQVDAVVIDTNHKQHILLGMSFLNRVKFSQEQGMVVLESAKH